MSELFTLEKRDFLNGLIMAVFTAILTTLYTLTQHAEFNIFTADWVRIGGNVINVVVITVISYLGKNYLTDSKGTFLGKGDVV